MHRPSTIVIFDEMLTAQALERLLLSDFSTTAIATDEQELFEKLKGLPDLVLMSLGVPLLSSTETMRRITATSPRTKIIVMTCRRDAACVAEAFRAGTSGYLLTGCAVSELQNAVDLVLNGRRYIDPAVGPTAMVGAMNPRLQPKRLELTARQRDVLRLIAEGRTAKEIASALGVSVKTAVFHKTVIMDKLSLRTTAQLTRYAIDNRIVTGTLPQAQPLTATRAAAAGLR